MTVWAKDAKTLVAEVLMSKQNWAGSFFILEGDSDSKFWKCRKSVNCEIVIAGGKATAVQGIQDLGGRKVTCALGLVDDDHDALCGRQLIRPDLVYTDLCDLEMCAFETSAFDKILSEYADDQLVAAFEAKINKELRVFFEDEVAKLGKVRLLCRIHGMMINLEDMVVRRFVDTTTLVLDWNKIEAYAIGKGVGISLADLNAKIGKLPKVASRAICRGHDLVDLLAVGFEGTLGSSKPGRARIATALRGGVERAEIMGWDLTSFIKAWEQSTSMSILA